MNVVTSGQLRLVAPQVWKAEIEDTFRDLNPKERDLACSIISALHSRHVGITPGLAADAARILLPGGTWSRAHSHSLSRSKIGGESNPWQIAIDTMRYAASHPSSHTDDPSLRSRQKQIERLADSLRTRPNRQGELSPHASFRHVVFRIIAPLIIQACASKDINQTLLFCEDTKGCHVDSPKVYKAYVKRLREQIQELSNDETNSSVPYLFWQDRVFALQDLTQRRQHSPTLIMHRTRLPESRVIFDLNPQVSVRSQAQESIDLSKYHELSNPRLTEPGADGATLTRRLEDFSRILKSEFIYPPLIRLDRIINTGFWAIRQPPRPAQVRDVLVIGMCPGAVAASAAGILLKSCWIEFSMHLCRLLQSNGLWQSEIRWIEGDDLGRVRSNSAIVGDLPEAPNLNNDQDRDNYHSRFLSKSGWFPSLLDTGNHYTHPLAKHTDSDRVVAQPGQQQPEEWLKLALHSQREFVGWKQRRDEAHNASLSFASLPPAFGQDKLQIERFRFVHFILLLPDDRIGNKDHNIVAEKAQREHLRFASLFRAAHSTISTWVPDKVNGSGWYISKRRHSYSLEPDSQKFSSRSLAGKLIDHWLEDFIWEIQHV
ncbi:MAG: hypothetical protein GY832_01205 [Chloroflexi bacterium]|nr:hypothetical protein [Chloroflexota bacterium]